ncbi:MAG: hypothetical protein KGY70_11540 [Bacteroidales bacterium]|nr:hypothetical protein [Bacteroidales bacterium]
MKFTIFGKTVTMTIENSWKTELKKLAKEKRWFNCVMLYKTQKQCSLYEAKTYIDKNYRFNA